MCIRKHFKPQKVSVDLTHDMKAEITPQKSKIKRKKQPNSVRTMDPNLLADYKKEGKLTKMQPDSFNMLSRSETAISSIRTNPKIYRSVNIYTEGQLESNYKRVRKYIKFMLEVIQLRHYMIIIQE